MNPKFSVIIATYNSGKTLQASLDSLLLQTVTNFEIIIVDGLSSDNTIEIVKDFEEKFKSKNISYFWLSEKDSGLYDAWNKAIAMAQGEWISFLGSDDYYLKNALETYNANITKDVNYMHSKVRLVDKKGKFIKILGEPLIAKNFFRYMKIAHVGSFHHKNLFTKEKFSLNYKSASDYYFFLKNYDIISSVYIEEITAVMQYGGISTNLNLSLKEALKVKLISKRRNKFLCYLDYFMAYLKYFVGYIRKI